MAEPATAPRGKDRRSVRGEALAAKLALCFFATSASLGALIGWQWLRRGVPDLFGENERQIQSRTRELIAGSGGLWDTHPDPDVGRVLLPELDGRRDQGVEVRSNRYGMREAAYQLPKPPDVLRVVLVGDSMIFGYKMPEELRVGAKLKERLEPLARAAGRRLECLHLGLSAWNLRAECAYVRRQVSLLQPDVVLHFTVSNDLDDNPAARGFGAFADFTDQARDHANGLVTCTHPRDLGAGRWAYSPLDAGLDYEGRTRFETAARDVARLKDAVVARGGRYCLVVVDPGRWPSARCFFERALAPEEIAYLPALDDSMRLEAHDAHWNSRGMACVADYCYGLLRARRATPALALPACAPADEAFTTLDAQARRETCESRVTDEIAARVGSAIVFDSEESHQESLRQVHGGIAPPGLVLPYASMILRNDGARRVLVDGVRLDRPELAGGVDVYVEELRVGRLELGRGPRTPPGRFTEFFDLPGELAGRRFVTLRFVADDWVLDGENLRRCVCFGIVRVGLER